ncbi:MAG: UDP-N-acetylmuramate dehydrogenase [Bacteroidales bacterium]
MNVNRAMAYRTEIQKSLKHLNTFGVECLADSYFAINHAEELIRLLKSEEMAAGPLLILGGGSNILFTRDFAGAVIHICNKGIEIEFEDEDYAEIRAQAGEEWDDFVNFCLEHNLGGVENLVAIPGRVGAAPVQNIGAYGVEVKDVIQEVEAIRISDGQTIMLDAAGCGFGYRNSIFKGALKGKVVITSVLFRLSKHPEIFAGYGDVKKKLDEEGITAPTIRDVARVIGTIRGAKLPDPKVTGNAGSFFKNPVVDKLTVAALKAMHSDLPSWPQPDGNVKLAAGWLIEQCGLKGYRMGGAAVHERQALVLVNTGGATGIEVLVLAEYVIRQVEQQFGIRLEPEVNIL